MKIKPIVVLLSIIGFGYVTSAQADILTSSGQGSAESAAPYIFGYTQDTSYISGYGNTSEGDNSAYSDAWGNDHGTYRASAGGSGKFESKGQFHRSLTITNTTGFSNTYSLNMFIYYGSLSVMNSYGYFGSVPAIGTGWASYDLGIYKNGGEIFDSYAKITSGSSSVAPLLERHGTLLADTYATYLDGGIDYNWGGMYVNLNLGSLGNNESMTIDFDLVSTAYGDFTPSTECGYGGYGYGGDGYGVAALSSEFGTCNGNVYASLGDPSDYQGNNDGTFVVTASRDSQIPIPGSLYLLGIGLAGLGVFRRKNLRF